MMIKKIELILILLSGHIARAPTKGRLMGLPIPDIVIYHYIKWEMPNNSAFSKIIKFINWCSQLIIYSHSINKKD